MRFENPTTLRRGKAQTTKDKLLAVKEMRIANQEVQNGVKFAIHHCLSQVAVLLFLFLQRDVVVKLADQVAVRFDVAGFSELASEHPLGAVDWVLRLLAASNLLWWGGILNLCFVGLVGTLAYFSLRRSRPAFAPFAPWLACAIFVLPTLSLGTDVWRVLRPHFPQLHLMLFAVLAGCMFGGIRGLIGFVVLQGLLVVVGRCLFADLHPLESLQSVWALPLQFEPDWKTFSSITVVAFFVLFVLIRIVPPFKLPRWTQTMPLVLAIVLAIIALPRRDCRDQLRMERAVMERRFADVLRIAPDKKRPERMETAWRILAMFRTDRLDKDLFRYPMAGSYKTAIEQEMVMEGPHLLFHYGLVNLARRWVFDSAAHKGWQPQHFRLLGDIASVAGNDVLARKYYCEYARFPFRAKAVGCPDRKEIEEFSTVWRVFSSSSDSPVYAGHDTLAERVAYTYFLQLQDGTPAMLKMLLACALLEGTPELLRDNIELLQQLYPDGRIGPAFMRALR